MFKKSASSISIISGADGPTSVFIAGKGKATLSQKIQKKRFQIRKAWYERHIPAGNHTMDEVYRYITEVYGFEEVSQQSIEYQEEYRNMRAALIMQYAPELLGEYAQSPKLSGRDEAGINKFLEQNELRQKAVRNVSPDSFDIDLHIYKRENGNKQMRLIIESRYGHIAGGTRGYKKGQKLFEKIYRDVYKYYGVTNEDVEHKTKRYNDLITTLAIR